VIWCKAYFDILKCSAVNHGCDRQTDGWGILVLNYVTPPETEKCFFLWGFCLGFCLHCW